MERLSQSHNVTKPGRPKGRDPVLSRQSLLDAARDLFARREFAAVSLRQIAQQAQVNPAMIHYHFGGKEGLYGAMLEEQLAPLLLKLEQLPAERASLSLFIESYVRMLAANPWLPNLVVREVLYGEGGFRELFIRRFAARAGRMIPALIDEECRAGRLRADLDPTYAALSLVSMALFPFIGRPVLERVLDIRMDEAFVERWVTHALRLFYEGAEIRAC